MNSQFLLKPIPIARIREIAKSHYQDVVPIFDKTANNSVLLDIPAGGTREFQIDSIGNWDLLVTHLVGTFTTVQGAPILDDGVSRLQFNLRLSGWNRDLSRQFFPVEQFFTPGRVRHPSSTNNTGANQCAPSNGLIVPRPLPMLLLKTQAIVLSVKSTSDTSNRITCSLHGWRVTVEEKALKAILDSMDGNTAAAA